MPSIPSSLSESERAVVTGVMAAHGYDSLTQTQAECLSDGVLDGGNWVLVAETGNGKTLVGECRVRQVLDSDDEVVYLVPSHRLVEEKAEDLRLSTPDSATVTTNPRETGADVVVRTFDAFFRSLLYDSGRLSELDLVVLDDFHEMYSSSRGPGIEKAIAAIREAGVDLFAMSATIGNPDHIARWLDAGLTLSSERRGVPIEEHPIAIDDSYRSRGDQIAAVMRDHTTKAPFLVFCNSRRNCEARARAVAEAGVFDGVQGRDVEQEIEQLLGSKLTRRYRGLVELIQQGVAYHHAGLDRDVQDYLTDLVHEGALSALFCTPTLAYGFDAPIQSVLVSDLKRWSGQSMEYVAMYEYVQWIGRAGRPGYGYDVGYAFPMYKSLEDATDEFQFHRDTTEKSLEPVRSHLDDTNEFRVLLLELVGAGWTTPPEIESFLEATFYRQQLQLSAEALDEWGMGGRDPAGRIKTNLGTTASWLVDRGFLEQRADSSFTVTPLGEAMTRFVHDTWGRYTIMHVLQFLDWLRTRDEFDAYALLEQVVSTFETDLGETTSNDAFRRQLAVQRLGTGDVGQTVGLLAWYWCAGVDVTDIEQTLDIDASYLPSIGHQLDDLLGSVARFFRPLGLAAPEWYETLRLQLRYGVSAATVRLVEAVDGVGRVRVASLKEGLSTLEQERGEDYGAGPLADRLSTFRDDALGGDRTLFRDVLGTRSTFEGIGPTLANRIDAALPLDSGRNATKQPFDAAPDDLP